MNKLRSPECHTLRAMPIKYGETVDIHIPYNPTGNKWFTWMMDACYTTAGAH